jgi:tRNA:m4X modification enzyme
MSHEDGLGSSAQKRIYNVTGIQVQVLLAKLGVILPHLPLPLDLQELISNREIIPGEAVGGKHVLQETSIISHLRRIGALDTEIGGSSRLVAIELGAGTARLSDRLQRTTNATFQHVLIDRRAFQQSSSRDRHMLARSQTYGRGKDSVERVVADIASLNLDDYVDFSSELRPQKCVCMSKHLCGPACDLAIASVSRVQPPIRRPPCALASCCHYLCTWESFSGKAFWLKLGLDQQDFEVAVTVSQWASLKKQSHSKTNVAATQTFALGELDHNSTTINPLPDLSQIAQVACVAMRNAPMPPPFVPSQEFEQTFSRQEKASLGVQLKQLLDLSRVSRLQELGYVVELVRYTTQSVDDRLLLAFRPDPDES